MRWKISTDNRLIASAVERQMSNWELARQQRRRRDTEPRPEVEDFLTVSRQVGVDGEGVARRLADGLAWPVFGKRLLEAMAGDDSIRRQIYSSMDERDLRWWQEALRSLVDENFSLNDYFRRLSETVLSLSRQGSCIFVGRGCDMILPSGIGFRVRLVAPVAERLEGLAQNLGLSVAAARSELARIEAERREFLKRHYRAEADDPLRHDLVLNLGRWSTAEAVDAILAARGVRSGR